MRSSERKGRRRIKEINNFDSRAPRTYIIKAEQTLTNSEFDKVPDLGKIRCPTHVRYVRYVREGLLVTRINGSGLSRRASPDAPKPQVSATSDGGGPMLVQRFRSLSAGTTKACSLWYALPRKGKIHVSLREYSQLSEGNAPLRILNYYNYPCGY